MALPSAPRPLPADASPWARRLVSRGNGAWLVVALVVLDGAAWEIVSRTSLLESATHSQPALRVRAAVTGVALLALAAMLGLDWVRTRARARLYPFEVMLAALVPLAGLAAVVGFLNANQRVFIIGDSYRVLVVPVAAAVTVWLVRPSETRRVLMAAVAVGVIAAIPRLADYAQALVQGESTYARGAASIVLLAYLFVLLAENDDTWRSRRRWALNAALIALLGINVLSLGKGEWLAVVVTVVMVGVLYRRAALRALGPICVAGAVAAAGAIAIAPGTFERVSAEAEVRLADFFRPDPGRNTISGDQREAEVREALTALGDSTPLAYLVGKGSGAEYPTTLSAIEPTSRPGHRHHIHVTFVSVLFRMGAVGLAVLAGLLGLAAWAAVAVVRATRHGARDRRLVASVIAIWLGVSTAMLFISYGLLGDLQWGVFLGLLGVLLRERDAGEDRGPSLVSVRQQQQSPPPGWRDDVAASRPGVLTSDATTGFPHGGRVLILAAREPTNDPRVWRCVQAWSERGVEVVVVASCEGPRLADERSGIVTVRRVPAGSISEALRALRARLERILARGGAGGFQGGSAGASPVAPPSGPGRLAGVPSAIFGVARMIRRSHGLVARGSGTRPALVHAHDDETWMAGILLARRAGVPVVLDAHEVPGERRRDWGALASWIHRGWCRPWIRRADAVITVNEHIAAHLAQRYGIARPTVVWNCPALTPQPPRSRRDGVLRVLYHGWYSPDRGLDVLIRAAARVPAVELRLRGSGQHELELRAVARECGLDPDQVFLPPVAMSELVAASAGFDVGAIATIPVSINTRYSSPNKLFEYLMAGLCVVSSDLEVIRPIVEDSGCGVLVAPGDVDAWASALDRLSRSPRLVAEAGERARLAAETRWSWERQAEVMVELCSGLVARTDRRRC